LLAVRETAEQLPEDVVLSEVESGSCEIAEGSASEAMEMSRTESRRRTKSVSYYRMPRN
jgi:hypothetical protein